jgi:3'-phosphoadenosine 5'-phosphosulfate sulfotransferase (PAPS reductase)/FAD synthetase
MSKHNWIVVSFSGGKDSSAMLLRMIELGEHIDEVVCCDTYKEFPAMYRHIEKVKGVVDTAGIKFTMLKSEKSFDYYMFEHQPKRKRSDLADKVGFSWAGSRSRWCTARLKQDVVRRYFKQLHSKYNVIQCLGIATDETYRLERKNNQNENHRHPLVEWGWTEKDALKYCYEQGYDWEGLYELFDRVSCWCCPLQPLSELRTLQERFPELWEELKDMDRRTWRKFRADYSVEELDVRFNLEREFEAQGKSIRSREFFNELKTRLS